MGRGLVVSRGQRLGRYTVYDSEGAQDAVDEEDAVEFLAERLD